MQRFGKILQLYYGNNTYASVVVYVRMLTNLPKQDLSIAMRILYYAPASATEM